MLNKEYIESLLKDEDVVSKISKARTQFSFIMTEFYFFNTFFMVLESLNIHCSINKQSGIIEGDPVLFCYIEFAQDYDLYTTQYDQEELVQKLLTYNALQSNMSMSESVHNLIDIFLSLLV